jgi:hypothetical protein
MSHLVALTAPQIAAHTVKRYAGFGILGADIPTAGDNGGSPVLNDGIAPGSEYHWRLVTPPASGTLTLYPDLSFDLVGAADGDWSWQYRLFENGADQGAASVSIHVGAYSVTVANSQQANQANAAAIRQTHLVGVANSQQANQVTAAGIGVTHRVGIANSQQVNTGVAASVSQSSITFVSVADSIQITQADAAAIRQTHRVGIAGSQQANQASGAAVVQTAPGALLVADSLQTNQASAVAISQTHRVGIASSQQVNRCSGVAVSDGTVPAIIPSATLVVSATQAMRLGVAHSFVNSSVREIDLANTYFKGGAVRLFVRIAGASDADTDPAALTLKIRFDSGPVTVLTYGIAPEIVRDQLGRYHADIDLSDSGTFHYRWEAGTPNGAAEGKIPVAAGRFN